MVPQHNNARPHVHSNVNCFLTEAGTKVIRQPPYSPDLAPCDFWLNDNLKRNFGVYETEYTLFRAVISIQKIFLIQGTEKRLISGLNS